MNILVMNYEYPPLGAGGAPVCRDLAVEMLRQGHTVTVVTMGFKGLPLHEEQNGVDVFRVKCMRKHKHSCSPIEQMSFIRSAERFLKTHLKTYQYDICHTHFIFPTGPIALWIKKQYGIPYILTAHGSDVEGHNSRISMKIIHRLLRPAWKTIVREAYCVTAPSEHLLQLMDHTFHSGQYVPIPNGLEIEKYSSKGCPKDKRILVMGRLQEFKNVQTILRAIARISANRWNNWHVDILGDGPYRAALEQLSRELAIEERVSFRGWIDNSTPEQISYLKKAAVFISASHFENCPMAVLEAIAARCYPLLSDIKGHRQFFQNGADNYFFRADDAQELAGKLERLLSAKPGSCSVKGTDISAYDNHHIAKRYLCLLEQAAKKQEG